MKVYFKKIKDAHKGDDMILTLCFNTGRNAMGDSYKNIINQFSHKDKIIVVIPDDYSSEEYDSQFFIKIKNNDGNKYISIIKFVFKLRKLVISNQVDKVLFYFDNSWINIILFFLLKNCNITFYTWVHDPCLHLGENWKAKLTRKLMVKLVFPYIEKIIVSYQKGVQELVSNYGINEARIQTIWLPEMLELQFPELKKQEIEIKKYNYDIIFFGRIEKYKGLNNLLEALNKLCKSGKRLNALIIGKGRDEDWIKGEAKRLNVTFINEYVDNFKLAQLIIQSRYVVLPYVSATGSQTVQVANYYNKPVLATPVGCFEEYIVEGVNGIFIKELSSQAIIDAINIMDMQYEQIKAQISAYSQNKFDINRIVTEIEKIMFY